MFFANPQDMTEGMRRAVVVDDDEHVRRLVSLYLRQEGFTVVEAGTAPDALAAAESAPTDLVIVDLILPAFSGIRLCRKIREFSPARLVVVTGDDDPNTRQAAFEAGADAFLAKPFDREALLAAVRAE